MFLPISYVQFTLSVKLTFIGLLLSVSLFSQSIHFKKFTTADGLLSDEVYTIYQDSQGYVWIFTEFGTLKYNGKEFTKVLNNLNIKDAFMCAFYERNDGRKWLVNSNATIYEIRNDSAIIMKGIVKFSASLKSSVTEGTQLCVDDSANVYLGTKGFSYKLIKSFGVYQPVNLSLRIQGDTIRLAEILVKGKPFLVYNRKKRDEFFHSGFRQKYIKLYGDGSCLKLKEKPGESSHKNPKRQDDILYFSVSDAVVKVRGNTMKYIKVNAAVSSFCLGKDNHIWICTRTDGIFEVDERDSIINHYFYGTAFNDILIDKNGGVWASSPGNGLYYCSNPEQKQYVDNEPLGSAISFIKQLDTLLFIGNQKGDVFAKSRHGIKQLRFADNNPMLDVTLYNNNRFWFAGNFGVEELLFSPKPFIQKLQPNTLKQNRVFTLNSDTLVAAWHRGLSLYKGAKMLCSVDFGQKILSSQMVNDTVWLGTENGVFFYSVQSLVKGINLTNNGAPFMAGARQPKFLEATKDFYILSVLKNNQDGSLWFSTLGHGMFRLLNNKLVHYGLKNELPSEIINNIGFGPNRQVYLCTNNGLYLGKFDKDESFSNSWIKLYNGSTTNAIWFDKVIYAATNAGLIMFNDQEYGNETQPVFCNLASVKINDRKVNPSSGLEVRSNEKSIEFDYDIIGSPVNKVPLCYMLYGTVSDSAVTNNYNVRFSRLQPGEYVLKVYPLMQNGQSFAQTIYFKVIPEFWQTAWFKLLSFLTGIALVIGSVLYFVNRRRKRDARNAQQQQLIEQFKLVAIQAQINPHFMSNCLSAVQSLIQSGRNNEATFYVARFGLLVRRILDYSSLSLVSLANELELLEIYIELEQLRFENKFNYRVKLDTHIQTEKIKIPPLLLHPLVENAVWHGLAPNLKKTGSELSLEINMLENMVQIKVCDNGAGRSVNQSAILVKSKKSYGIPLTTQRLESINFLYNTQVANLKFNDLKNNNGTNCGTEAIVTLPINLEDTTHDEN